MTDSNIGHKFQINTQSDKSKKLKTEDLVKLNENTTVIREEPKQKDIVREKSESQAEEQDGQERIRQTIEKFQNFLQAADDMKELLGEKLKDYTVTVPVNEAPEVRDAIRRLFGQNSNTITYEMFERCLQWRSEVINKQRRETYKQSDKGE